MTKSISVSRISTLILTAATHVLIFISMGNMLRDGLAMAAAYFVGFVLLGAWASGPYVLSHWRAALVSNWSRVWIFPALSVLSAVVAIAIYYDAVLIEPLDAQASIVFAVIPVYQYILIVAAAAMASWLRRRSS